MGNGMNKIMPGLYVGNYRDSKDSLQLANYGISHILSIHDTAKRIHPSIIVLPVPELRQNISNLMQIQDKHYLCIIAADTPNQNLSQYFSLCNDFIHAARLREGNVLIHCLAGMSRSVTVTVAYIMSITSLNWKDALKVVRVGRAVANPNDGFQKQLQDFETNKLTEERKRLKERFPTVALKDVDEYHCQLMLKTYEKLLMAKHLCEGNCSRIEVCPTGICNFHNSKKLLRRYSIKTVKSLSEVPSTSKAGPNIRRPQSGPAILMSSVRIPPARASSVQSLPELMEFDKPKFRSAPSTPQRSPKHKVLRSAPLVDLNEILDA